MDVERIQQGLASTIYADFLRDGEGEDPSPDSATVTVTRQSTGAEIYTDQAAIDIDTPAGRFAFTLSPSDTALLDTLTLDWTVTFDSVVQTARSVVEVVGGFLFHVADARRMPKLGATNNDGTYKIPTSDILQVRNEVEEAFEAEIGYSFTPRYYQETFSGDGLALWARHPLTGNVPGTSIPFVTTLRSATVDGTAVGTLADVIPDTIGFYYETGWTAGRRNVVIGYEHGAQRVPERAKREALILANAWLGGAPVDARATSMSTDDQTTTYYVPGRNEPFDIPSVNRFVQAVSMRVGVA